MKNIRTHSSHHLLPQCSGDDNSSLEGIAASVMVFLKLLRDHNDDHGYQERRVSGMISILDDVKARIEKSQKTTANQQEPKAEFRRCNTELRPAQSRKPQEPVPEENPRLRREASEAREKSQKPTSNPEELKAEFRRCNTELRLTPSRKEPVQEENLRLRREVSECKTTRKSIERMFSCLGKEKEIMEAELANKVRQLSDMEEELNDLKTQNERLSEKIKVCAAHHKARKEDRTLDRDVAGALQERNRLLSEQLLRSLDGYRALKRKSKEVQDENTIIRSRMGDIAKQVEVGLGHIQELQRRAKKSQDPMDVEHELSNMERMFRCFEDTMTSGVTSSRSLCV